MYLNSNLITREVNYIKIKFIVLNLKDKQKTYKNDSFYQNVHQTN